MVYSDFAQGMLFFLLILVTALILIGAAEIAALDWIMKRITKRSLQLGVLAIVLLLGYLLLINIGASIIFYALPLFIGPVTVLIPLFAYPSQTVPGSTTVRILAGYCTVTLFWVILIYGWANGWATTNRYLAPLIYWHAPGSDALLYAGFVVLDTLVAFFVYWIMRAIGPVIKVKDEKPGS